MKNRYQIQIVLKDLSKDPAHQATHIGGRLSGGVSWKISVAEAIDNLRNRQAAYYVLAEDGTEKELIVRSHPLYGPFLTVKGETREPKTLLALPEVAERACA